MKAILEFNLPEDSDEYETAMNAGKMSAFIHEMTGGELRNITKYDNFTILQDIDKDKLTEKEYELVQSVVGAIRSYIGITLSEYGLDNI
jgi:hypothetical protein